MGRGFIQWLRDTTRGSSTGRTEPGEGDIEEDREECGETVKLRIGK